MIKLTNFTKTNHYKTLKKKHNTNPSLNVIFEYIELLENQIMMLEYRIMTLQEEQNAREYKKVHE